MQKETREPFFVRCGDTTPQDWRNLLRVLGTLGIWAICFAGGSQLIKHDLLPTGPISWLVAALPSVAGIFVILAYVRFLRQADELQRVIQLNALALGFGGTFFAIAGYRIFERLGAPPADLGDFTMVMAVLYSLGTVLGWSRYR